MVTRVLDTSHGAKGTVRRHRCECGSRWTSDATLRAGSLVLPPLAARQALLLGIAEPPNGEGAPHLAGAPTNSPGSLSSPDLGLSLDPDLRIASKPTKRSPNKMSRHSYSEPFERAWALYPRRDEKTLAYAQWLFSARDIGEERLAELVIAALGWQVPTLWDGPNWRYAKFFARYLKARKWEDEQPSPAQSAHQSKNGAALSAWLGLNRGGSR